MSENSSRYSSYKALEYLCGHRLDEYTWCRQVKSHHGDHHSGPEEHWTAADDAAVAAFLALSASRNDTRPAPLAAPPDTDGSD